jgi:YVTN family beta-propeller protein
MVAVIDGLTNVVITTFSSLESQPIGLDVNPLTNRVYVANFMSNTIAVFDGGTFSPVSTVPTGAQPLGVGVNPSTNLIYVSNQGSNSVSVIDGNTNTVITTVIAVIPVGITPQGIGVNP